MPLRCLKLNFPKSTTLCLFVCISDLTQDGARRGCGEKALPQVKKSKVPMVLGSGTDFLVVWMNWCGAR